MRNRNSHHPTKVLEALGNCQPLQHQGLVPREVPQITGCKEAAQVRCCMGTQAELVSPELPLRALCLSPPAGSPQTPQGSYRWMSFGLLWDDAIVQPHSERLHGYLISKTCIFWASWIFAHYPIRNINITWALVHECKFSTPHQNWGSETLRKRPAICILSSPPRDSKAPGLENPQAFILEQHNPMKT